MDADIKKAIKIIVRKLQAVITYCNDPVELESAANLGVATAIKSFDPTRRMKLANWMVYAGYTNSISTLCNSNVAVIKKPKRKVRCCPFGKMDNFSSCNDGFGWRDFERALQMKGKECIIQCDKNDPNFIHLAIPRLCQKLSNLERQVALLFCTGHNDEYIAKSLGQDKKSIDNSLSRIRQKAKLVEKDICRGINQ